MEIIKITVMKLFKIFTLSVLSALLLVSCVQKDTTVYENADDMVAAAKAEIQIVDCREDYDFILGHITGSIHIPRGLLEFSNKISNRRIKTLVIGNEMGSGALAVKSLELLKYSDCYMLDFSWFDWEATYPELVEQGMGESAPVAAPKKEESSGGCGG